MRKDTRQRAAGENLHPFHGVGRRLCVLGLSGYVGFNLNSSKNKYEVPDNSPISLILSSAETGMVQTS